VMVRDCMTMVRPQAEAKTIVLTSDVGPALGFLHADETRVRQVLINMLSNAVKFTPMLGKVSLVATITADGSLALAVTDNGIGMTEEQIEAARQPFRQIDSSLARKYEGTGLGIPLAEGLMRLHGGYLQLDSRMGAGTTATAVFPPGRVNARCARVG